MLIFLGVCVCVCLFGQLGRITLVTFKAQIVVLLIVVEAEFSKALV